MGDNKISEAVDRLAQVIREVDGNHSLGAGALAEAIIAKLPHLQGEAVPVASADHLRNLADMIDPERQAETLRKVVDGWSGWATQYPGKMPVLRGAREIAELNHYPEEGQRLIFLAEQPAELSEVSGNSGELGDQKEFISDIYIVAGTPGMTPVDLADWIRDVLLRNIYALAATGKQQVGEVKDK